MTYWSGESTDVTPEKKKKKVKFWTASPARRSGLKEEIAKQQFSLITTANYQ